MKTLKLALALAASVALPTLAFATDLDVTHWWTSGGGAAAVAGSGGTARPIIVRRIIGGDVNLRGANDCMKKGLDILAAGSTMPDVNMLNTEDAVDRALQLCQFPASAPDELGRPRPA